MLRERCHQRSKDSVVAECHVSFSCEIPSRRRSPTFILMPMFCKIVKSRFSKMQLHVTSNGLKIESKKNQCGTNLWTSEGRKARFALGRFRTRRPCGSNRLHQIRPESSKSQTEKKETIMGACGNWCISLHILPICTGRLLWNHSQA
ncbi:hypothetical protein RB195_022995 [Necator americanus]|uniref:Uncharacterized protein n=1 Tax=Necator americanus TaxID=51031 RepID=A0ABR1EHD6_NECAM